MSKNNTQDRKTKKIEKLRNKLLFTEKKNQNKLLNYEKFDVDTGEKIALDGKSRLVTLNNSDEDENKQRREQKRLASLEIRSAALGRREKSNDLEETIKDVATGGSLGFLSSHTLLKNLKIKGAVGLGTAAGAGYLSQKKQKSEFNKQQAAREIMSGKSTDRANQYKEYIKSKYGLNE